MKGNMRIWVAVVSATLYVFQCVDARFGDGETPVLLIEDRKPQTDTDPLEALNVALRKATEASSADFLSYLSNIMSKQAFRLYRAPAQPAAQPSLMILDRPKPKRTVTFAPGTKKEDFVLEKTINNYLPMRKEKPFYPQVQALLLQSEKAMPLIKKLIQKLEDAQGNEKVTIKASNYGEAQRRPPRVRGTKIWPSAAVINAYNRILGDINKFQSLDEDYQKKAIEELEKKHDTLSGPLKMKLKEARRKQTLKTNAFRRRDGYLDRLSNDKYAKH